MTCKTGQMSICTSVRADVNIFKPLKLWDRWADVDETWHMYSELSLVGRWIRWSYLH